MRRWQVLAAACALLWLWTLAAGAQPVAAEFVNDLEAGLEAAGQETQSQIDEEWPFGDTQGYWTVEDDERWARAENFAFDCRADAVLPDDREHHRLAGRLRR